MTQAEMKFFSRNRFEQMEKSALKYHNENPEIYDLFCKFTLDIISRGFHHYGSQSIFEQIRWHTDRPDVDGKTTFKLNNNHRTFYTLWFARDYPQHDTFFRQRRKISLFSPPSMHKELTPQDFS